LKAERQVYERARFSPAPFAVPHKGTREEMIRIETTKNEFLPPSSAEASPHCRTDLAVDGDHVIIKVG